MSGPVLGQCRRASSSCRAVADDRFVIQCAGIVHHSLKPDLVSLRLSAFLFSSTQKCCAFRVRACRLLSLLPLQSQRTPRASSQRPTLQEKRTGSYSRPGLWGWDTILMSHRKKRGESGAGIFCVVYKEKNVHHKHKSPKPTCQHAIITRPPSPTIGACTRLPLRLFSMTQPVKR